VIACGQDFPQHIAVPRGCLTEVLALLHAHKIRPEVRDERFAGTPFAAEFDGQLRSFQEEPVAGIGGYDEGILCAPTAFGKTTVAPWLGGAAKHIFVLKGGMGKKQRRQIAEAMAAVPDDESRVILATGSYIGEGLDDARLDTLFLAMPISCKGGLAAVCWPPASSPRQQARGPSLRLRGQRGSDAGKNVRAQIEGLQRNRLRYRADDPPSDPSLTLTLVTKPFPPS
jgi:hypothetical protein